MFLNLQMSTYHTHLCLTRYEKKFFFCFIMHNNVKMRQLRRREKYLLKLGEINASFKGNLMKNVRKYMDTLHNYTVHICVNCYSVIL